MRIPRTRVGLIAGYPVSRGCGLTAGRASGHLGHPGRSRETQEAAMGIRADGSFFTHYMPDSTIWYLADTGHSNKKQHINCDR